MFFPYITHTLSIRTTVNICSCRCPLIIWSDILSTHAKLTCSWIQSQRNAWLLIDKEGGTYDVQVHSGPTDVTHRLIGCLKQELDESADEA